MRSLLIIQITLAEVVNSAGTISTGILESVDVGESKSSESEELIQEEETVNARNNMYRGDHREEDENRSYHLHHVVCEKEGQNDKEPSSYIYVMFGLIEIVTSSWALAIVVLFHVK